MAIPEVISRYEGVRTSLDGRSWLLWWFLEALKQQDIKNHNYGVARLASAGFSQGFFSPVDTASRLAVIQAAAVHDRGKTETSPLVYFSPSNDKALKDILDRHTRATKRLSPELSETEQLLCLHHHPQLDGIDPDLRQLQEYMVFADVFRSLRERREWYRRQPITRESMWPTIQTEGRKFNPVIDFHHIETQEMIEANWNQTGLLAHAIIGRMAQWAYGQLDLAHLEEV